MVMHTTIDLNNEAKETAVMEMKDKLPAINAMLANPPAEIGFSAEEIEEIVRGENLREHLQVIDEGDYLEKLLAALAWYSGLAHILLYMPIKGEGSLNESSKDTLYMDVALKISEIMRLYDIAFKSRYEIDCLGSDPTGLEIVKQYKEFAKYIRKLAQRDFPEANWDQIQKAA
jgi:hypothetical protein